MTEGQPEPDPWAEGGNLIEDGLEPVEEDKPMTPNPTCEGMNEPDA